MKIAWKTFNVNNNPITLRATEYDDKSKSELASLYFKWSDLNSSIKKFSTRGINLPEAISENAFCLFFDNCVRVVSVRKGKCSFDVFNTVTGKRIQIKATSVKSDLTSFGPRSEWDELYFLDFSSSNGVFDVYKIDPDIIYKHQVNATQTFEDQQNQGRRPRFSIKKTIEQGGILPVTTCSLV